MSEQSTPAPVPQQEQVEYRDARRFPGYRVGADGSVWSCWNTRRRLTNRWKKLKPVRLKIGYFLATVSRVDSVKPVKVYVHQLVLEAFVGPCPDGSQCRHLDGDRENNRPENLAWGSPLENSADTLRHGTRPQGSRMPAAKLTEEDIPTIRRSLAEGESVASVALRFGVSKSVIKNVGKRKAWFHVR